MKKNIGKEILHSKWFSVFEVATSVIVIIIAVTMLYLRTPAYENIPLTYANITESIRIGVNAKSKSEEYARIAESEGNVGVSRLFTAYSTVQGNNALKEYEMLNSIKVRSMPPAELFNADTTAKNIDDILAIEKNRADILYPVFINEAEKEKFNKAKEMFEISQRVAMENVTVFEQAKSGLSDNSKIFGCMSCGKLTVGDKPDKCNLCNKKEYREF